MTKAFILTVLLYTLPPNAPSIQMHRYVHNTYEGCQEYLGTLQTLYAAQMEKDGRGGVWRFAGFCYEDRAVAWPITP